jgi:hypothetical protein
MSFQFLPTELILFIANKLDLYDTIHVFNTCKSFKEVKIPFVDEIRLYMNMIFDDDITKKDEKMLYCINLAFKSNYLDIVKTLTAEVDHIAIIKFAIKNFDMDNHRMAYYFVDYLPVIYISSDFHTSFSKYIIRNNDKTLFKKYIGESFDNIKYLLRSYAYYNKYEEFVKCYELCSNLCFCNTEYVLYKNYRFSKKGVKLNDDWTFTKRIKIKTNNYCGGVCFVKNDALYFAAEGKSHDIIKFLINKGCDNYNRGLIGAVTGGDLDLVKYFVDLGATYIEHAVNEASNLEHLHLFSYFYEKIGSMDKFEDKIGTDTTNPINFYIDFNKKPFNEKEFYLTIKRAKELGWNWSIDPIIKLAQKHGHDITL